MFVLTDFNEFIIDPELLKRLYEGHRKYVEIQESGELFCPWCGTYGAEHFEFYALDPNNNTSKGILVCLECRASSPPGTVDEGTFTFTNKELNGMV